MSFDWKLMVDVARQLEQEANKGPANAEALRRSAVGRAYFGAFCYARNYAKNFLKYTPKGDEADHGALRAHLKGKRRKGDADRLDRLRQWRNNADYLDDLPWADAKTVVAEAIKEAERIFQSLAPPSSGSR